MKNVKFSLTEPKSNEPTLIMVVFRFGYFYYKDGKKVYQALRASVKEFCSPSDWDFNNQRVDPAEKNPYLERINNKLDLIEEIILSTYNSNKDNNPTPDFLKQELFKKLATSHKGELTFIQYVEDYIKECRNGDRLKINGEKYARWTIKGYKVTLSHLKKAKRRIGIASEYNSINIDYYKAYLQWFTTNDYSVNTIGEFVKNTRVFLQAAADDGIHKNFVFRKFKYFSEKNEQVALTDEEVNKIYSIDFSDAKLIEEHDINPSILKRLEIERDRFVLVCRTMVRFGDYHLLCDRNNYIKNKHGEFLNIETAKTKESIVVPLHRQAREIVAKYNYNIPPPKTNQEMNRWLKVICRIAGLNDLVTTYRTSGGKRKRFINKKYEKVTTHTARRSGATIMYFQRIPMKSIMLITGHKTESSFLGYINVDKYENAYELARHPYFL